MCEEGAPGQGGGTVGVTVEGDLRGVKAGCDGVVVGGAAWRAGVRQGRGVVGRGWGYQWGMVSAAEAAGKADILIKQPQAKSH